MSADATPRYDEAYFRDTYGVDGLRRFSMHWWSARLYARIADRWLRRIGGRRVLDVGCGHGFILSFLDRRYETWGIDMSEYAIAQCARFTPRSRCFVASVEAPLPDDLPRGGFDFVIARYVFEHLRAPGEAMRRLVELLRPGGVLFFSVPNTESIGARWKGADWYAHKDPTHVSLLSPAEWIDMTRLARLNIERETSDGYWDLPYVRWLPKWLQFPLFIGPSALTCLTGRAILPARFGENVMILASRPADDRPHEGHSA